jgi:hypothetical protein
MEILALNASRALLLNILTEYTEWYVISINVLQQFEELEQPCH